MKIVLLFVLCAVAYTVAEPDGVCPEEDPLDKSVYLPDTDDCFKFYECSNGVANELYCSPGTYFQDDDEVCETHVKCGDKNTTPKGYTTPAPGPVPDPTTEPATEPVTEPEPETEPPKTNA